MFDYLSESQGAEANGDEVVGRTAPSLRQKRLARKQGRCDRQRKVSRKKLLSLKNATRLKATEQNAVTGPTPETLARLEPDPLRCFRSKNILNNTQIRAFQRIRQAINIITEGSRFRICQLNDVMVDCRNSIGNNQHESDYEIRLKDHYSRWIDQMTATRCQAGPVLDIIIDEMSLSAVDRKWGKRKGWAKTRLQHALDLYQVFSSTYYRNE